MKISYSITVKFITDKLLKVRVLSRNLLEIGSILLFKVFSLSVFFFLVQKNRDIFKVKHQKLVFNFMCIRPIRIKNPTWGRTSYASEFNMLTEIPKRFTPNTEYIEVPCGKCADCRNGYYNSILQRAIVECQSSYMYFFTLTYDNKHLPVMRLDDDDIYYADYNDIQNLFKRLRASNVIDREFRYLVVNEYGDRNHRPHFHILLFIARLDDDEISTPFNIETILKKNIRLYFAKNVGTRKNPKYETLFTYRERVTQFGRMSNYFVKYVQPSSQIGDDVTTNSDTYVKTIRYLIGYLNKLSRFDEYIEKKINEHNHDEVLVKKLRNLLKSKLRFSKGFGFGFLNGKKLNLPRISVRTSLNTILYSQLLKELPKTFYEFSYLYPELVKELENFIIRNPYSKFKDLNECLETFNSTDYFNHCYLLIYFPNYFNSIYKRYFRISDTAVISYFFNMSPISYLRQKIYTTDLEFTPTYQYLRKGVDEGLNSKLPYFAFKVTSDKRYIALCKFYRERICTISDIETMYNNCGLNDYQEWKTLFEHNLDLRKTLKSSANNFIYKKNSEKICTNQKKYLGLHSEKDLYQLLFTKI